MHGSGLNLDSHNYFQTDFLRLVRGSCLSVKHEYMRVLSKSAAQTSEKLLRNLTENLRMSFHKMAEAN